MLKKIIIGVVLLILAGAVVVYFARNILVERAVEAGSEYALGQSTDLGSASLSLGAGSLELSEYEVANTEGFPSDHIFAIRRAVLDVATGSILDNEVVIDSLVIDGLTLTLEQKNQDGNYAPIIQHIKQADFGQSEQSDRRYTIRKAVIRDAQVSASINLLDREQYEKSYTLESFEIGNIGSDKGATIGQVSAIIFRAVVARALEQAREELPEAFGGGVKERIEDAVDDAKSDISDKLKDAAGSLLDGEK
ncbi:hypothetical protein GF420_05635 [candidate division GN15 bacterium]|nr:hypothetical protein [candidate division GN15 bacterium]